MSTEVVHAGIVVVALSLHQELEKRKSRKVWVKNWVARRKNGASNILLQELKDKDTVGCQNILRMDRAQFDALLQMIDGLIGKQDTKMRMAIPTVTKLEITLRYIATGDSFKFLEYLFRVPECMISLFVPEVLTAISQVLKPFIKVSESKQILKSFIRKLLISLH